MRAIERRSYLRVADPARVDYVAVSEEQARASRVEQILGLETSFSARKQLFKLELDARELQRELAEKDRTLGSYIYNLNERLEHLSHIVVGQNDSGQPNMVDVSPGGIAYRTNQAFPADDLVAMKIAFSDVSLAVACYGIVRYSLLDDDETYRVGVQFMNPDAATEALITRHLSALQAASRRKRLLGLS